jgi:riboflavin-specific deaminase-like protein
VNVAGRADERRPTRPWVTVKLAQTLDGRIATATGDSQWISGDASLRLAHELRASHDAVLVGIGTVLGDDPRLTVRLVPGDNPLRIVVDTRLRLPLSCHLLSEEPERTIIAAAESACQARAAAIRERGARILPTRTTADGRVDLADLLRQLAAEGVRSLMVEGGACIVTSLLRARLVDRMVVSVAPKLLGTGVEAIGDLGIRRLADAMTFTRTSVRQLGDDVIFDCELADRDERLRPPSAATTRRS